MHNKTDNEIIMAALRNMRQWHDEGRSMPGYIRGNAVAHLADILGIPRKPVPEISSTEIRIDRHTPNLWVGLAGPHGWTIYKMLMIRKGGKTCAE